ncbi:poly-gamma-glutamate biosynthesis protein PgsC/CapC [Anaerovirgula multivorans]|uniref:Poly-gamma-glutamate biosynthesis protein PgsC/CapC n=1 Tax=Anaerovirgula multivorans TaxID=312168 RepID=A0A239FK50_9FIRM|nr:poly-gamma-glutamate biosynthesis protein PgsC [Anaerovirgula multivorans]SNS57127.1 poly-gamma-glutamate biosynthesis protein PgsC/CapC [Anaerovirgula multivorans]
MITTDIYIAIIIGIILSLLFTELTGVLPAGLVVPGYLSLIMKQPQTLLLIFLISLVTYLIVTHGIARITILYGKRKFTAMITIAIIIKYVLSLIIPDAYIGLIGLAAMGAVIPGLIANTIQRQGFIPTITSTGLLTILTYVATLSIGFIG